MKYLVNRLLSLALVLVLVVMLPLIIFIRANIKKSCSVEQKNILFGFDPLINNKFWAQMLKNPNYRSDSVVLGFYSINKASDFDYVINNRASFLYYFFYCFLEYDIHVMSFNGGLISKLGFSWLEPIVYRAIGIKTIIMAYGSDVSVYDFINKPSYFHVLNSFYPQNDHRNKLIKKNLRRWQKYADFVVPAMFFYQGLYRNDLFTPNSLNFPVEEIEVIPRHQNEPKICIVHSPNHRIIKGSEYIINVIERLKNKFDIEFIILEGKKNEEVLSILKNKADIFIEKLIGPSYALSAIEAMSYGVPVIGSADNGDWDDLAKAFRRYSFLRECPITSASIEDLEEKLTMLCESPRLRHEIALKSRDYVMRYHSFKAGKVTFNEIIKYVNGERGDLKNFYHPLCGEFKKIFPSELYSQKNQRPLANNQTVD